MKLSCIMLGEVEARGSTPLDGKPLPHYNPSISRHHATSEEKLKLQPKSLHELLVARLPVELIIRH